MVSAYKGEENENGGFRTGASSTNETQGRGEPVRLGEQVRILLVAVGGGAVRIAREIARLHVRHLELVAVNCDARVQSLDEFDRRIFLGPETSSGAGTGGSPVVAGTLARAAQPALERIFDRNTVVFILGSLGGGTGTGVLPCVIDAACRRSELVTTFVVKPFACEGERRSLADRVLARLAFIESFTDRQGRGQARLWTLDNESLRPRAGQLSMAGVARHWAGLVSAYIQDGFIQSMESSFVSSSAPAPMAASSGPELPVGAGTLSLPPPAPLAPLAATTPTVELALEIVPSAKPAPAS